MDINGPSETIKILSRIKERLNYPDADIKVVANFIKQRAGLEEKYANMLTTIIPQNYDDRNPILKQVISDARLEITQHRKLAAALQGILPGFSIFTKTFLPTGRQLQNKISKSLSNLESKWSNVQKHRQWIFDAQAQLETVPINKKDSQIRYIQKLVSGAEKPESDYKQCLADVESQCGNEIFPEFNDFERQRIKKLQEFSMQFVQLKSGNHSEGQNKESRTCQNLATMDIEDKSDLYVKRMLNPKLDNVHFDDEIDVFCYAIDDFSSDDPNLLSFVRGDKIRIIKIDNKTGWYKGELRNKQGLYPSTFTMVPKVGADETIPFDVYVQSKEYYRNQKLGEIDVNVGDILYLEYLVGKRCYGYNCRTNEKGLFPFSILDLPNTSI